MACIPGPQAPHTCRLWLAKGPLARPRAFGTYSRLNGDWRPRLHVISMVRLLAGYVISMVRLLAGHASGAARRGCGWPRRNGPESRPCTARWCRLLARLTAAHGKILTLASCSDVRNTKLVHKPRPNGSSAVRRPTAPDHDGQTSPDGSMAGCLAGLVRVCC